MTVVLVVVSGCGHVRVSATKYSTTVLGLKIWLLLMVYLMLYNCEHIERWSHDQLLRLRPTKEKPHRACNRPAGSWGKVGGLVHCEICVVGVVPHLHVQSLFLNCILSWFITHCGLAPVGGFVSNT